MHFLFLPDNTGYKQDRERKDKKNNNSDNIMLAETVAVSQNIKHIDKESCNPSIIIKTASQSFRADSPFLK